jgi:hypothetical protein
MLALALAGALTAYQAAAVGTRRFVLEESGDFEGGDLKGVAVDSGGRVRAGLNLGSLPLNEATTVWSALRMRDGSLLLGTGNDGKLIRVRDGKSEVVADAKAIVISSLAEAWGDAVVLGTVPNGKVMQYTGGKLSELATLTGSDHVWQVVYDAKSKSVFAATGPEGKLFRIGQDGKAQVYFDAEEPHLMSLAVHADGTLYAGTSGKAKLYKITGPGRASVLHDFARTEVRAVTVAPNGDVFAVANELKGGSDVARRVPRPGDAGTGPTAAPTKTTGKGVLYRFSSDGLPDKLLESNEDYFVSLALDQNGRPYVGTGAEGRVYTVEDNHNSVLVADTEERQIGALLLDGKARYVIGSDPAVVHPVEGVGGTDAVWTSKVLDAGIRARFGQLSWESTGALELSTRSGGTAEPDDTWSPWSTPMAAPAPVQSPVARYLQVRARWNRDPSAVLSRVEAPFVTDNLRAVIQRVDGKPAKSGAKRTATGIEASGGPVSDKPTADVALEWKVDNPDKDELRYRLEYRMVGTDRWYSLLKPKELLSKESYTWDTSDLPEGRYRVRVIATDEHSNPPERVTRHELESGVILVDNTPPTIENLRIDGSRVRGTAIDGVGPIQRIEIALAGSNEWYPFHPEDGVFDEQREEFSADVTSLASSRPVLLSVRVYDQANNSVVRSILLR